MPFLEPHLTQLKHSLEGKIDFQGQDLVDRRIKLVLWSIAAVAFLVGLVAQSLKLTMALFGAGLVGCLLWVAPPLPAYTQHPVAWLSTLDEYGEPVPVLSASEGGVKSGEAGLVGSTEQAAEGRKG
ncbi:hypothetical protein JCM10207_005212 [Rhodosporidiobolus poonsookiae]